MSPAVTHYRFARRAENLGKSVFDHVPGSIILNSGLAYPPLLPDVSREAASAAKERTSEVMQYSGLMGLDDLREAIAAFVLEDGIRCGPENILVTNGAKHAVDLACRVFVEPGDRVIVTAPTYMTSMNHMRTHGASFLTVPQDDDGMMTEVLEAKLMRLAANAERMPKLLFDVPDFHNPTGITMSLARRQHLVELASQYGFVILEDDPYRRVRFEGDPIPPIKSLDQEGVVLSLGTVSKILSPGLRLGWAIGEPEIVKRMGGQKSEGGSGPLTQRIVVDLMRSNRMADHIEKVADKMREHRDVMVGALAKELPDAKVKAPSGGYFLWAELPEGVSGEAVADAALEQGVEVSSGRLSFPEDDPGNFLRFAYSYPDPEQIVEGVRRLGRAYRDVTSPGR